MAVVWYNNSTRHLEHDTVYIAGPVYSDELVKASVFVQLVKYASSPHNAVKGIDYTLYLCRLSDTTSQGMWIFWQDQLFL